MALQLPSPPNINPQVITGTGKPGNAFDFVQSFLQGMQMAQQAADRELLRRREEASLSRAGYELRMLENKDREQDMRTIQSFTSALQDPAFASMTQEAARLLGDARVAPEFAMSAVRAVAAPQGDAPSQLDEKRAQIEQDKQLKRSRQLASRYLTPEQLEQLDMADALRRSGAPKEMWESMMPKAQVELAEAVEKLRTTRDKRTADTLATQQLVRLQLLPQGAEVLEGASKMLVDYASAVQADARAAQREHDRLTRAGSDPVALRKEFDSNAIVKQSVDVAQSFQRILAAGQSPSAAGDLALIFNYMKMLDPGSSVREGEFANAQNAAGIPERLRAQYNNLRRGERLTEETRADFIERANMLAQGQQQMLQSVMDRYTGFAQRAGVDPSLVTYNPFAATSSPPAQTAAPGAPAGGARTPQGEALLRMLPPVRR